MPSPLPSKRLLALSFAGGLPVGLSATWLAGAPVLWDNLFATALWWLLLGTACGAVLAVYLHSAQDPSVSRRIALISLGVAAAAFLFGMVCGTFVTAIEGHEHPMTFEHEPDYAAELFWSVVWAVGGKAALAMTAFSLVAFAHSRWRGLRAAAFAWPVALLSVYLLWEPGAGHGLHRLYEENGLWLERTWIRDPHTPAENRDLLTRLRERGFGYTAAPGWSRVPPGQPLDFKFQP